MIRLRRLNGKEFVLNCELIKTAEAVPDTVLTLTSGETLLVRESIDELLAAVHEFRQRIQAVAPARAPVGTGLI